MDKISNVNFTGIRNIARVEFKRTNDVVSKSLSMVLKDDVNGKDLTEFNSVIKKITDTTSHYKNNVNPDVLNIECGKYGKLKSLYINGKYIEANDKNLPVFSYLGKLTKKISAMPDKNFYIDKDYLMTEADEALIHGVKMSENLPDFIKTKEFIKQFFEVSYVKKTAKDINNFIQNLMNKYFNID